MATRDNDGEFGKAQTGATWEQSETHGSEYPLGKPRPFYLPPKEMDARLRSSVDAMELHIARGRAERLVQEAANGQTPEQPSQVQAFAKSLVERVPTEKRALLPQLTSISQKGPMMRNPTDKALLAENQNWFGQYHQGLEQLIALEKVAVQNQIAPQGKPVLLALTGDKLPVGTGEAKTQNLGKTQPSQTNVNQFLKDPKVRAILQKHIDANPKQPSVYATKAHPSGQPYPVEFCKRDADFPAPVSLLHLKHWWLRSPDFERGMGPARGGVPGHGGIELPYISMTKITDHKGEGAKPNNGAECIPVSEVNERYRYEDRACLEELLKLGRQTGSWTMTNQCHTIVIEALETCRIPQPAPEFSTELSGGSPNDGGMK